MGRLSQGKGGAAGTLVKYKNEDCIRIIHSGVGRGASGASADAPTVGHRWQSDTDGSLIHLLKKKKEKKRENRLIKEKKTNGSE